MRNYEQAVEAAYVGENLQTALMRDLDTLIGERGR